MVIFFCWDLFKKWWDSVITWCQQHVNSASAVHLPSGSPNATHIQWLKPNAECSNTNTQGLNLRKHVERSTRDRKSPQTKFQEVVFSFGGRPNKEDEKNHIVSNFGLFSTKTWLLDKKEEKQSKTIGVVEMELVQHLEASEGRVWSVVFRPGRDHDFIVSTELAAQRHGKVIKNKIQNITLLPETNISPENRPIRPQEGRRKSSNGFSWLSGRFLRFREGKIQKIHGTTSPMTWASAAWTATLSWSSPWEWPWSSPPCLNKGKDYCMERRS